MVTCSLHFAKMMEEAKEGVVGGGGEGEGGVTVRRGNRDDGKRRRGTVGKEIR